MEILSPPRCQRISPSFYTKRRKRIAVIVKYFRIRYSFGHEGLKPRPLPRSSRIIIDEENPNETLYWKSGPSVCAQIEKSVLHKRYFEALDLFELLKCDDYYDVDSSTYDSIVSACIETRSIRGVKRVYNHMNVCGYDSDQYLEEAFDFISKAPFSPTVNMWAALLTACRVKKDLVLRKIVAEKIYGVEPEKLENYIVLLNICNSLGLLREAADVVKTLKRKGIEMHRASTWIEVKKVQHVFHLGDKSHYQMKEIYEKVEELVSMIPRKHGYVVENKFLLPDVDEKEEKLVFYHSEKLAIGFGLINTSKTTALQLVQSHRICVDCHSAVK